VNLLDQHPWTGEGVFVAPCATLVGSVSVNAKSAVMYGAVVRGDQGAVDIGAYTTVQDRAVIKSSTHHGEQVGVTVGDFVVVGTLLPGPWRRFGGLGHPAAANG
jgi:carbonic anhydrase/acetyltransferase-like protein (isoleucine patch superfamily)